MFRNWTFGRRLAAGFGLAAIVLVLIGLIGFRITSILIQTNADVLHTHAVRTAIADITFRLKEAESGQRGFIITGQQDYLAPYDAAVAGLGDAVDNAQALTADNADQQERIKALRPLLAARLDLLGEGIALRRTEGLGAAIGHINSNAGKEAMDEILALVAAADLKEVEQLNEREDIAKWRADLAIIILLWGSFLGAAAIGVVGWLITRALSRQIGGRCRPRAELLGRAAGRRQPAGDRRQGAGQLR